MHNQKKIQWHTNCPLFTKELFELIMIM
jgi:hypothetical protein